MSSDTKLHRAVSTMIQAGFQLEKEAFEFLDILSKTGDPHILILETLKKLEILPEKPLFISRNILEDVARESSDKRGELVSLDATSRIQEGRKAFHPCAKDFNTDLKVVKDPTEKLCTNGTIEEYNEYFKDRFNHISQLLKRRLDARYALKISAVLKEPVKSDVKIIGMVTEKREMKGRIFLKLEDEDTSANVLVPQNSSRELLNKARKLLLDQVICVVAVKGRDNLLIAKEIIWPDIPQKDPRTASLPIHVALISDLHLGSKMFMRQEFNRFIFWLNGKYGNTNMRNLASQVKYVIIAGDIVDGVGIYPKQLEELAIQDIYKQYQVAAELIEQIPDYIEVIIIPGNHDASRKALPQPGIFKEYAEPLYESRKIYSLGNPSTINLHGVEILVYHGRSLDDVVIATPNLDFHLPTEAMKLLLQSRHLAPIYGDRTPIAPEKRDHLVIGRIPDVFHAGHVHVVGVENYRGTLIVNSGAWQRETKYQKQMGMTPTPGIATIVNLQTLRLKKIPFAS